jgi:hypothetical protein
MRVSRRPYEVEFLFRIGRNMRVLDANGVAKDVDVEALDRAAHAGMVTSSGRLILTLTDVVLVYIYGSLE